LNTLVKTTTEAAGANCATGGTRVDVGSDLNNNGTLDALEVNAALTKYVCNGAIGSQGPAGNANIRAGSAVIYPGTYIRFNTSMDNTDYSASIISTSAQYTTNGMPSPYVTDKLLTGFIVNFNNYISGYVSVDWTVTPYNNP